MTPVTPTGRRATVAGRVGARTGVADGRLVEGDGAPGRPRGDYRRTSSGRGRDSEALDTRFSSSLGPVTRP